MLPRFGMGGGNATNHALFAERTDLKGLMQIYGQIGNHHTVPTAVLRWTEALTMAEYIRREDAIKCIEGQCVDGKMWGE